jgi:hypothetical protein
MFFIFQHINYHTLAFFCIVFFATINAAENYLAETLAELSKIDTQQLKTDLNGYCTTVNSVISKKYGRQVTRPRPKGRGLNEENTSKNY